MKILLPSNHLIYLFIVSLFLIACQDDEIVVPPDPTEPETVEFKLKSQQVVSFQNIENGKATSLHEDKLPEYFGKRVQAFVPVEIVASADSTTFVKEGLLKEKFKTKWDEGGKLYLYNDHNESWTFLGEKAGDTFLLKTVFFSRKISSKERAKVLLGQAYGQSTYDDLILDQEESNLIWLQIDAFFN